MNTFLQRIALLSMIVLLPRISYEYENSTKQLAQAQSQHAIRAESGFSLLPTSAFADDDNWDDRFDVLGVTGAVLSVAVSGTDVYTGGVFSAVGSLGANNIAKWTGSSWSTLDGGGTNGTDGTVLAIAINGSNVVVGGSFSSAGGVAVNNIATWNGTNWQALGDGIEGGDVRSIVISGTDIFVGGVFTTAGGQAASNIAKWDGNSWSTLGTGINGPVYALAVISDDLYAGGSFSSAGGNSASNIAKWNSTTSTWSEVGGGANLDVNALAVSGTSIYVGGLFATVGSVNAKKIAKWDGAEWTALGAGITGGDVNAVDIIGNRVFVGGTFTNAGAVNASRIAKWDGSDWVALGSGITGGFVFGIAADLATGQVYAGGSFDNAGGKTSNRFAHWSDPDGPVPVELTTFSARPNGTTVLLNWTTATEDNNFGFDIERKTVDNPEEDWQRVAFVKGHGTTLQEHNYAYVDDIAALTRNGIRVLRYRLKQIDLDGQFEYFQSIDIHVGELPEQIILAQNYPNPFNPQTTIEFVIPEDGFTVVQVHNLLGQEVQTLVSENLNAGVVYRLNFDGATLPSGTYFYVVRSGAPVRTVRKSMLLLK